MSCDCVKHDLVLHVHYCFVNYSDALELLYVECGLKSPEHGLGIWKKSKLSLKV